MYRISKLRTSLATISTLSLSLVATLAGCDGLIDSQEDQTEINGPTCSNGASSELAFPTAKGFGKKVTGGRGGEIRFVTNLDDSGPGSLRAAVSGNAKKVIVFKTGGRIQLKSQVTPGENTTFLGQTAPGDGIMVSNHRFVFQGENFVVRHMRFRPGDPPRTPDDNWDGLKVYGKNMIFDHISLGWGADENMQIWPNQDKFNEPYTGITVQRSVLSEGFNDLSFHSKDTPHGYGLFAEGDVQISAVENLFACQLGRNPLYSGQGKKEFISNVVRNDSPVLRPNNGNGQNFTDDPMEVNAVNNYMVGSKCIRIIAGDIIPGSNIHLAGNATSKNGSCDYSDHPNRDIISSRPTFTGTLSAHSSATEARDDVLNNVGANFQRIDPIDTRAIEGTCKNRVLNVADAGGWPSYQTGSYPADADNDGISDEFEKLASGDAYGLDAAKIDSNTGYMWIENYANWLVGEYNVCGPETETPDTETPDTETPDTETPDTETPDTETPDTETPDTETPGPEDDILKELCEQNPIFCL